MEVLGGVVTLVLLFALTWLLAWRQNLKRQRARLPPGPTPLPLLGNALQLFGKPTARALLQLGEKYGPVFTVYLGMKPVVVLCGPDVLKEALFDQADVFSGRGEFPVVQFFFKGYGIAFSNGERWKQLRRFSLTTLRNFGMGKRSVEERIQEEACCLVEELRKTKAWVCRSLTQPGCIEVRMTLLQEGAREQPLDPTFFLSRAVANIICSIVFGNRFEYKDQRFLSLLHHINENFRLLNFTSGKLLNAFPRLMPYLPGPFPRMSRNITNLKNFVLERIAEHQETLDLNCPRDFIDCFLIKMEQEASNAESEFHNENLVVSALNLFFAGTETVSTTIRYGFLILLKYPEVQKRVHEEIDHVVGRERSPGIEDRSKMPYTDAVVHEIQRFSDIVPGGIPHCTLKDTNFRGHFIPKGTTVFTMLTTVLNDPGSFPNPGQFDPGNFLDNNGVFKKNDSFIPFSAGKRVCVGEGMARMELFLFITTILQNFTLKSSMDPAAIDLTPEYSGLGSLPRAYKLCLSPR